MRDGMPDRGRYIKIRTLCAAGPPGSAQAGKVDIVWLAARSP
jgi:hypothetical protein